MTRYITDMGGPLVLEADGGTESFNIGRYGVWDSKGSDRHRVIDTGDDLDELQARYGPGLPVYPIQGPEREP